jgi:toxin ParE1/3/4
VRVSWSLAAEEDHEAIVEYIFIENPSAAVAVGDRIKDAVLELESFPQIGRVGRLRGTHELVLPRDRCVAIYRILDDTIEVVRVIHGGQKWPDESAIQS